ncbi:MAG: hypothetical protein V1760_02500 [Candidatus Peregrinibacteria bacterium]
MKNESSKPKGIASLIVVIVVSAVALLIATTSTLTEMGESQSRMHQNLGKSVFMSAESCLEEAFIALNIDRNYAGGSLEINGTSCTIAVSPSGNSATISVTGTKEGHTRKLQAQAEWSGAFEVTAWQELLN